ncbi:MAG TPA: V4R domain-containing protein [Candidatus Limnocylindrales bacterium]|nr:V4R domain-containing protein [Candidatus Limnocylindrales bacterium]
MRRRHNLQTSPKGKPNAWDLRRLVGSVNQLRFNDNKGELSFFGQKMIILRRDVIRVMRDGLERLVADQAAPFLSYLASGIGIHEGSIFRDSITATGEDQRVALESLVHSAFEDTNLGLGKVKIRKIDFDRANANVVISNCFEAMENGSSEEPNCMFTSGFLAGLFAEVLDKTVQAKETQCISQGQPECEFEISSTEPIEGETTDVKEPSKETVTETANQLTKPLVEEAKPTKSPAPAEEPKTPAKAMSPVKDQPSQSQSPGANQSEVDAGVERASRIAKRKQGFWEKHFKKNE